MMRSSYNRFCALLAVGDLRKDDIQRVLARLRNMSAEMVVDDVSEIRNILNSISAGEESLSSSTESVYDDVIQQINRLMLKEARLTKSEAAEAIWLALNKKYPERRTPPPGRAGFANWLRTLLREYEDGELLHVITRIRNDFAHSRPEDDWLNLRAGSQK